MRLALRVALLLVCWGTIFVPDFAMALTPAQKCEQKVVSALRRCVKSVRKAVGDCYELNGAPCAPADAKIAAALAKLDKKVLKKCADAATVQAAGYGALMTPPFLVARLREACLGEPASLAARSFGGPHAAALAAGDVNQRFCLKRAYDAAGGQIDDTLKTLSRCVLKAHAGAPCDAGATFAAVLADAAKASQKVLDFCGPSLPTLVALDPPTFIERASDQAECLTAAAVGDSGPLTLYCGPRSAAPVPARGVTTQVVLPEMVWGSRCGNGSPYAFQLRLPPAGEPLEKVVVHLQGGGACFNESSCAAQSPSLFSATDDGMPAGGYMSNNAANNPVFANWTKVFLPYCTQDLHIGGGIVNAFPSITVNRFGALNARAALRYLRDVLWAEMDATQPEGYRPDRLQVMFGGTSAGGYGVNYNYHYVLDDLRWAHSTMVPDAGLALGSGVLALGTIMTGPAPPTGWAAQPMFPPYCFAPSCAVGPTMKVAHAARLLAVPEQQILEVSNQVDNVQVSTTLFPSLVSWINAVRASYCANQGIPGLQSFLSANTSSIHGTVANAQFSSLTSAGIVLGDWLGGAATTPAAVTDAVSEGTLVAMFGADPFACPVSP